MTLNEEELVLKLMHRAGARVSTGRESGQTTAEYALVIVGVAIVAAALGKWAAGGAIEKLFDSVISKIL